MENVKFELEFLFKASPFILYTFFTTPANLVRWFCDEVDIQDDRYTFGWNGSTERADLVEDIENEHLKFEWLDRDSDDDSTAFTISTSPMTGETVLLVTECCHPDEQEDQKIFLEDIIKKLRQETGS